jgi:hypothetical protein
MAAKVKAPDSKHQWTRHFPGLKLFLAFCACSQRIGKRGHGCMAVCGGRLLELVTKQLRQWRKSHAEIQGGEMTLVQRRRDGRRGQAMIVK